jgi:hypothetical protein
MIHKRELVRASIAAITRMREINPAVRIFQIDPIINVIARSAQPHDVANAEAYRQSQFEAWDMLTSRTQPGLGGDSAMIDAFGVNYYIHNQFVWQGTMVVPSDPRYRHVNALVHNMLTIRALSTAGLCVANTYEQIFAIGKDIEEDGNCARQPEPEHAPQQ